MSDFSAELRDVLGPAIEAGRAALADQDDDGVAPGLRRVRAYSGGRLPAPLAVSLLEAIDTNSELRSDVLERVDVSRATPASTAFLEREGRWWTVVAAEALARSSAAAERHLESVEAELAKTRRRVDVARERLDRAREEWNDERAQLRQRLRMTPGGPPDSGERKARNEHLTFLESALGEAQGDLSAAERMVARLSDRLRRMRRDRSGGAVDHSRSSSLGDDPLAAARQLDLMAAAAPHREEADLRAETSAAPRDLGLPAGIRSDAAEAIEALIAADRPITILIDGYNVLYAIDHAGFTTGRARGRLLSDAGRLARLARLLRISVIFDSSLPGDADHRITAAGIDVRFTEDDTIADDEIVRMAEAVAGSVVVITSDRELQSRVEAVGALALFSEAWSEWAVK